ncbi:hypothetical protein RGU11_05870 [Rossellomorea marisflavi]|jgi:hypothetical protein|uniref:hypothetical protein n=1 Tax=Rossellomorea marisflavi TaxID=189381 RepID=UPI0028533253|nr:hypothetical protein [Rossellomorea marisflavi]MDR4935891.1 hypothetical protein [Rossellomorea marisflavi]
MRKHAVNLLYKGGKNTWDAIKDTMKAGVAVTVVGASTSAVIGTNSYSVTAAVAGAIAVMVIVEAADAMKETGTMADADGMKETGTTDVIRIGKH